MDRRSEFKNYMLPGIYHITVKAAETLRTPFGKVVGNTDKPDGDPDAPRVALSPVGKMVEQELLHSIAAHYSMVEVQDYVIMPEHMHFIVEVKARLVSKNGKPTHLGQLIGGFKKGCNRQYWAITGNTGEGGKTAFHTPTAPAAAAPTVPSGLPTGIKVPSDGTTGRAPLFNYGYCDVMPIDQAQLEQQRAYIKGNPRSRLLRSGNREWLRAQRGGIDTAVTPSALRGYLQRECAPSQCTAEAFSKMEDWLLLARRNGETSRQNLLERETGRNVWIDCDSYGDRGLLERKLLPVVCHRKNLRFRQQQKDRCLEEAAKGAVLVSPRIAPGEQDIMDEVVNRGFPVILIADNGFPEVYHPSTERIERCAEGMLLIVTPWKYHYRMKDEGITVMECKTMNCIAQALCRKDDEWWKREEQTEHNIKSI